MSIAIQRLQCTLNGQIQTLTTEDESSHVIETFQLKIGKDHLMSRWTNCNARFIIKKKTLAEEAVEAAEVFQVIPMPAACFIVLSSGSAWTAANFIGREANEAYIEKLRPVADKLFKWLSMGIGLEGHELMAAVGGDDLIYMMKINYYPPCPRPDIALGVVPHTDMSTLTILVPTEVAGLQVFKDDRWYDVKYIPNALIVHIGDQIEILSNGKYKAALHRTTVNKETTRMSWPVFLEPPSEREIGPIPKLISDENPPKFKTKTYNDYVHCKLNKIPQ